MSDGLKCLKCGNSKLSVKDSRQLNHYVRRVRVCLSCAQTQTTYEVHKRYFDNLEVHLKNKIKGTILRVISEQLE